MNTFIFECSSSTYLDCVEKNLFGSNKPWPLSAGKDLRRKANRYGEIRLGGNLVSMNSNVGIVAPDYADGRCMIDNADCDDVLIAAISLHKKFVGTGICRQRCDQAIHRIQEFKKARSWNVS